jgi:hypothetical protein
MPRVLNRKWFVEMPENAVYVGRPSKWGNPFPMKSEADRDWSVDSHEKWILENKELMAALPELRGKDLVCWCAPKRCHADTLLRLANQ